MPRGGHYLLSHFKEEEIEALLLRKEVIPHKNVATSSTAGPSDSGLSDYEWVLFSLEINRKLTKLNASCCEKLARYLILTSMAITRRVPRKDKQEYSVFPQLCFLRTGSSRTASVQGNTAHSAGSTSDTHLPVSVAFPKIRSDLSFPLLAMLPKGT